MLAGLLSHGAYDLYDRLVASGGLPVDGVPHHHEPALAELSSHGLLWESAGPPRRVRVVSEAVALRRLISGRQRELAAAHRRLADDYLRLEELESRPAPVAPRSSGVEQVHGPDQVTARLHDLVAAARRECRVLLGAGPPGPADGWPALRATVRVRVVCTPDVLRHEGTPDDGAARRVLPELPAGLTLVDDVALVPIVAGALVVHTPALVASLSGYFELLWQAAAPLDHGRPAADDAPTPVERQILRLAATGLKDEAIARSLGRSSRWVRRHFEALEERLGATNRLTLGIAAARRGWV